MTTYFRCEPRQLCGNVTCCRSNDTHPALTLGDYHRLSTTTGETPSSLWKRVGTIAAIQLTDTPYTFSLQLGLLHSPCPFLEETHCAVYTNHPLNCASFPLNKIQNPQLVNGYDTLPCVQGVQLSPEQERQLDKINTIYLQEFAVELQHLWGGRPWAYVVRNFHDLGDELENAIDKEAATGMNESHPLAQQLIAAAGIFDRFLAEPRVKLDPLDVAAIVRPIVQSRFGGTIGQRIRALEPQLPQLFEETTGEWRSLNS